MYLLLSLILISGATGDFDHYMPYMFVQTPVRVDGTAASYERKVLRRLRKVCATVPEDNYLRVVLMISKNGKPENVEIIDTDNQPQTDSPVAVAMIEAVRETNFGKPPKNYRSSRVLHE